MKSYFFDDPYARAFCYLFSAVAPYIVIGQFVSKTMWIVALAVCAVFFFAAVGRGIYCWRNKVMAEKTAFLTFANEVISESNLFVLPGVIYVAMGIGEGSWDIWIGIVLVAASVLVLSVERYRRNAKSTD